MSTITPVPPGNGGIVPPWLQDPPRILPMPDDWHEGIETEFLNDWSAGSQAYRLPTAFSAVSS